MGRGVARAREPAGLEEGGQAVCSLGPLSCPEQNLTSTLLGQKRACPGQAGCHRPKERARTVPSGFRGSAFWAQVPKGQVTG